MNLPWELPFRHENNELFIASQPMPELAKSTLQLKTFSNPTIAKTFTVADLSGKAASPLRLLLSMEDAKDFFMEIGTTVDRFYLVN